MATDDILIRFKADTGQLKAEFDEIQAGLRKTAEEEKKAGAQAKVTSKDIADAARRREVLLKAEIGVLKQLEQQSKKAFTPKDIAEFNSKIAQSQKNISLLKGEGDKLSAGNSVLGSSFAKLGGLITAAFSVAQIIAFGNAAVQKFAEAEKAANQLRLVFDGQEGTQRRLLKLADQLQDAFAIDNDVIIGQINFLGLQGRTESQIRKTIQAAIQLSAVTGEDLSSAVQKLDGTFEGVTGRLGRLDSRINDLTKSQLANGGAVDIINEKYAGFAERGLEGVAGQLQRIQVETENAEERFGKAAAPIKLFFANAKANAVEFFAAIVTGVDEAIQAITGKFKTVKGLDPKEFQIEGFVEQFKDLPERVLTDIREANEKIIAENDKLTNVEKQRRQNEIEAIKRLLEIRKQESEQTVQLTADELKALREAQQKEAKERADAQNAFAKFTFEELNKNADKEAAQRKLQAEETIQDEKQLQLELVKIDAETLAIKLQNAKDTFQDTSAIEIAVTDNLRAQAKLRQEIMKGTGEIHPNKEDYDKWLKESKDASDEFKKIQEENLLAVLDAVAQVSNEINSLLQANSDAEIERIEARRDANSAAIDDDIAKLEEQHEKGRIGDEAFEKRKIALLEQRKAAEKRYNDQVKKEKQEQAKIDKAIAIFNIVLNTAAAIVKALPNAFLAALTATLGAVQLSVAIATPIPAFVKGTKRKQGSGLARVGEAGEEIVFLPSGAKVLPAQKTREYSDVLDSMFDGKLDAYIHKNYVLPALKLQSPNVNINIDYKKLAKANQHPKSISIDNWPEFIDHNPRRVI